MSLLTSPNPTLPILRALSMGLLLAFAAISDLGETHAAPSISSSAEIQQLQAESLGELSTDTFWRSGWIVGNPSVTRPNSQRR